MILYLLQIFGEDLINSQLMEVTKISNSPLDAEFIGKISDSVNGKLESLEMLQEFISILNRRYSIFILYSLQKLEFSAFWELTTLTTLKDNRTVQQNMTALVKANIVDPIKRDSKDYDFILKFWKNTYRHSSRAPALYKINPRWSKIVKQLEPILLERINENGCIDIEAMDERMKKYNHFSSKATEERRAIQEKENNSMGKCYKCDKFILKTAVRGEDYHKFPIGLICGTCNRNYSEMRHLWMQAKK